MTRPGIPSFPFILILCVPGLCLAQSTYSIATVAGGNPLIVGIGDNAPAVNCFLNGPGGVAVDTTGNIYIADTGDQLIRKVGTNGIISTVAGSDGSAGYSGDGGPAKSAKLSYPSGLAVDSAGNIYIADTSNNVIRKVTAATGIITTVAGNPTLLAYGIGDGGAATSANLSRPRGVALDSSGNLYVADQGDYRVRKVTVSTGVITTVAGSGVNSANSGTFGDGGPAVNASVSPFNVALDGSGNIYIADSQDNLIRKVTVSTGIITTVAGNGSAGFVGDGGPAIDAQLNNPQGVAVDNSGDIFIADTSNYVIREVVSGGVISTIAGTAGTFGTDGQDGDGGPALSATLNNPTSLARTSAGLIYIADDSTTGYAEDKIRLLTPSNGAPVISAGGVVPIYSSATTIEPGSWVSIYGTNFASATAVWNGTFPIPTTLGGVSVNIDSQPAYLWSVSPTQINVQAPNDSKTGSVPVAVTTSSGTATSTATLSANGPSFSLLNTRYAAAIVVTPGNPGNSGGGYDIIGPVGAFPYATRPVMAGETLILYGVGFGPTNPTLTAGQAVTAAAPSVTLPAITIGGAVAQVTYGGIVETGLFQFNVVVPSAGSGDQLLQATVGGVSAPGGVYITLQ